MQRIEEINSMALPLCLNDACCEFTMVIGVEKLILDISIKALWYTKIMNGI